MDKISNILLGGHFDSFIAAQIQSGRYNSVSEVMRAPLRLLEEREQNIEAMRPARING